MTRVLASAAPARLRKAAQAGAGRLWATCRRQARKQTHVLDDWARAARQCGWVSDQPALRKGSVLGSGLDRYCGSEAQQSTQERALPIAKPPVAPSPPAPRQKKPSYLKPKAVTAPAPVESCQATKATPKRVGSGQLRLWSGTDVSATPATVSRNPRPLANQRTAVHAPIPAIAGQPGWAANLAKRAAIQMAAKTQLPDGASGFETAFAQTLAGEIAPLSLLERVALGRQPRNSPAAADPAKKIGRSQQEMAKPDRKRQTAGGFDPVASGADGARRAFEPTHNSRVGGKETEWLPRTPAAPAPELDPAVVTGRHAPDPLDNDTIHPPRHRTPVQLPPQPDLDPPFAEIVPQESRAALGRAQGAVADEPLTELPPPPAAVLSQPGFDRDELGEALAQVLRDEARRHGIDV